MKRQYKWVAVILGSCLLASTMHGCGNSNMFDGLVNRSSKEQAIRDIETGNYSAAVDELTNYLNTYPQDYGARSMLANAYMLYGGVNMLQLAIKLNSFATGQIASFQTIVSAMPKGTAENLSRVQSALDNLAQIPSASRSTSQDYQIAIANIALAILLVKGNCLDSNNLLSSSAIQAFSDTNANKLYSAATQARAAYIASGTNLVNTSAGNLSKLIVAIDGMAGATTAAKVRAYLTTKAQSP